MGDDILDDEMNINRKLSIYKHVKKKAANDAQLLMNRIALIQKEEERARKKIQETKERAAEIIALRYENERRVEAYSSAVTENKKLQQVLLAKNREQDTEGKKARQQRFEMLQSRRREEVGEMVMEKKYLTQLMIQEQEREIQLKQKRREEVRRREEEMKMKREMERQEKERKMKEMYAKKLESEAVEARRAEKLVKTLERKEREWIEKLKAAQITQDTAFEHLERALTTHLADGSQPSPGGLRNSMSRSAEGVSQSQPHASSSTTSSVPPLSPHGGSRHSTSSRSPTTSQRHAGDGLGEGVSQMTLSTTVPEDGVGGGGRSGSLSQQSAGSGLPADTGKAASAGGAKPRAKSTGRSSSRQRR